MKHVLVSALSLSALALVGCGGEGSEDTGPATTGPTQAVFAGAPLAELTNGDCPKLDKPGERTFRSYDLDRTVIVHFPKDPEPGLPVVFVWHGLGDSAAGIDNALRLEAFAEENHAIVVVPQSTDPGLLTWDIGSGGKDAALFDDMRTCLVNELDAEIERVTVTGFSFGGLFATWLAMERSDALAAAATLSGGTDAAIGLGYRAPASDLPVLVMWGGVNDNFDAGIVKVDFAEASMDFSDNLVQDGHVVVDCEHTLGHALPPDYADAITPWLLDHRFGEPSPFADDVSALPGWCHLP